MISCTPPAASEPLALPVNLGLHQRDLQLVQQSPCLGGPQGEIGHFDSLINFDDSSTDEFLPKLPGEPLMPSSDHNDCNHRSPGPMPLFSQFPSRKATVPCGTVGRYKS